MMLKPHFYTKRFTNIKDEWLYDNNITLILADIDNTLVPYHQQGSQDLKGWLDHVQNTGTKVVGTSNSSSERVEKFQDQFGIRALSKCKKPRVKVIKRFLKEEKANRENVIIIGDQLFTDILCGRRLGIKTLLQLDPVERNAPAFKKGIWALQDRLLKHWGIK
ncbi:YqeG family HAD IIIA-type phosphatase [Pseudalkalibacillus caeni]|uniref:YqeG family HAD IIIA-type phosphatase n=1 Tax=Exobacillus caeni TaxID=2574798 RepID=A0A5R9EVH0_9BACL|nr:YqeG family HAD IIIA-type phosphatase [Pseudalkalibacillus caeni]TLS35047.1 YqeG family HAD IIIA-type phosphatase [Pseudalkalibacillus caeni]